MANMPANQPHDPCRRPFSGPELAVGTILGFRQFQVSGTGIFGRLMPISARSTPWTSGENIARCVNGLHSHRAVADKNCSCGFYAYHSPQYAISNFCSPLVHGILVHGIIEAYGRVTIGTKGFRAEKARIKMLCVDMPLLRYHGIPRVEFVDLLDTLKAQGRPY